MHDRPFFTVVIPTFNRTAAVQSALDSVKAQTFSDFECLVVDDGSKDGDALADVVSSVDDKRFKYVRQQNAGACSARNRGVDIARGLYVAFLDSDDIFLADKLERSANALKQYSGNVLVYSQLIVERGMEKVWIRPQRGPAPGERVDEYLLCGPGKIQTSTMVLPTELARRVRWDEDLPSLQDADFAIRVANSGAKIAFIEQPLIVFEDRYDDGRVARSTRHEPLLNWVERARHGGISERAYWACRGWQCARVTSYSNRPYGMWLYFQSVIRGVYPARQAFVILAQVLIPPRLYQRIANLVVKVRGKDVDGRYEKRGR